jgi:hypothetical protein
VDISEKKKIRKRDNNPGFLENFFPNPGFKISKNLNLKKKLQIIPLAS